MLIVRPSHLDDLKTVTDLARLAGPGFTSLAVGDATLAERLEASVASFGADVKTPGSEVYVLMLGDTATGHVVGIGAIKAQVGLKVPFFSYRRTTLAQCSSAVGRRFDMDALYPVNEAAGTTEVGTLFVCPDARGSGAGGLVARTRYLLMAVAPQRFGERVIAELRGVVDAEGRSPFWEALGRPFFRMDFEEADRLSSMDNQFISDLLPTHPVYLDLLPEAARAVVGVAHPEGRAARKLLEAEGFRYRGLVDVFDAGPLLSARKERINTFRKSQELTVRVTAPPAAHAARAIVATARLPDFRAAACRVALVDGNVLVDEASARALDLVTGDRARVRALP
ncbi:MAG: arginine N-succinyltransferase [Polyangiaceae bacterium]|nr:arginine N-succinyltransferase [Polyangiaceae bacterium]